jgi:solute:Na+ symporter, SSS family
MAFPDWVIVAFVVAFVALVGFWFTRRASSSLSAFFVGDRTLVWWVAGTSILATSFAPDTPLHNTRTVREHGLGGLWFYWGGMFTGVLVAIVFSRLWRRTGHLTDNEVVELRYSGPPAAALRAILALFKAVVLELLTIAWVMLGMTKVVQAIVPLPEELVVIGLVVVAVGFSAAAGLLGVAMSQVLEFIVAMAGAVAVAIVSVKAAGGISGMRASLSPEAFRLVPTTSDALTGIMLLSFIGVQWWASPYADGSGQRAQRFLACQDERQAMAAGLLAVSVQWIVRSWPWALTALASLVLYPTLADHESAYPRMMSELLPTGLKGLVIASFAAAFMSTMQAQLNLTSSYLVHDVYRRFLRPGMAERHYVTIARITTIVVALAAAVIALGLPSVLDTYRFKMELMAGLGMVYLLRWLWWRVTAVTELVTLVASVVTAVIANAHPWTAFQGAEGSALRVLLVVSISLIAALATTVAASPEPMEQLVLFYRRVLPPGAWGPVAAEAGVQRPTGYGWHTLLQLLVALTFVLSGTFGLGLLLLGRPIYGGVLLVFSAITGGSLAWTVYRWNVGGQG